MYMPGIGDATDFFDMVSQTDWSRSLYRSLLHWVRLPSNGQSLDVGCGVGALVNLMAQRVKAVSGVDSSEDMIKRANGYSADYRLDNVTYVTGNIRSLPFDDHRFDLVTCVNLLFLFEDPTAPLRELVRVCKAGGQVVVIGPSADMNPWSAQRYCEVHKLEDFNRDSFLSWSTAAARRNLIHRDEWNQMAKQCGATLVDSVQLLDGLVSMVRIEPLPLTWVPDMEEPVEGNIADSLFEDV